VPIARPSARSSSPSSSSRASIPAGAGRQGDAHALGYQLDIGAVLDDHRHRLREGELIDVAGAEQYQRACPVDRLSDRRRLLEIELANHRDHLNQLVRHCLGQFGRVEADDLKLAVERRVVEP